MLTFHRCINYGSYWQARSLVEGVRAQGHDAVLADHHSRRVNRAEWKCALRPREPEPTSLLDSLRYARKVLVFSRARSRIPRSRRFDLDRAGEMEPFDLVVVGSDEVWNLAHPWYAGCPLFFGEGVRAKRIVSYAASFGNYDAGRGLEHTWVERLRRFDDISVRDENSRRVIRGALRTDPCLVLDPCLQFSVEPEGPWRGPDEPFLLVYGHGFTPRFLRAVRRWAREHGRRLVSIGYRNDWADEQWLTAGPHDFAHAMARADAIATNFFHGCVFALRNARPFVCETMPYRTLKIRGLLAMLNATEHLVEGDTRDGTMEARLAEPVGPGVLGRIDQLRREGELYLNQALA